MAFGRARIRDALIGPDVVIAFMLLVGFIVVAFSIPFSPIQTPGYLLAIGFSDGPTTVLAWYLIALIAGALSRHLRSRFGMAEWNLGNAVFPIASGVAVLGVFIISYGLWPAIAPVETSVVTCTPAGCMSQIQTIASPNLYVVSIGIGLVIIGALLLGFQLPIDANNR